MEKVARSNGMLLALTSGLSQWLCVCQTWVGGFPGTCVDSRGLAVRSPGVAFTAPSPSGQALSSPPHRRCPAWPPRGACPERASPRDSPQEAALCISACRSFGGWQGRSKDACPALRGRPSLGAPSVPPVALPPALATLLLLAHLCPWPAVSQPCTYSLFSWGGAPARSLYLARWGPWEVFCMSLKACRWLLTSGLICCWLSCHSIFFFSSCSE